MADPLSIGAGIVGIISLAAQVSQIVLSLGLDWKEAPETVKSFIAELQTLQKISLATSDNILNNPDFIDAFEGQSSLTLTQFNDQSGATAQLLDSCRSTLEKLRAELQGRTVGRSLGWQRVKSAFLAKHTQQAVQTLSRQFQTLNSMLAVDTAVVSVRTLGELKSMKQEQQQFNLDGARATTAIQTGVDELNQNQTHEKNRQLLEWLSPINYTANHDDLVDRRVSETGKWLLTSDHFTDWMAGKVKTVLGVGKPGSGKTMLTSIAIDHLRSHFSAQTGVGIAFLYFNFRRKHEQKAKDLLANILKQLSQRSTGVPLAVRQLHERHQSYNTTPTMSDIVETLSLVLTDSYSKAYFCIDALDECGITEHDRSAFLSELFKLQDRTQLGLFATSRDIPDVVRDFRGHIQFEIRAQEEDVQTYLRSRMTSMPHIIQKSPELQGEIMTAIVSAVDGMFLLAMLHMDSLYGSRSMKAVRTKLSNLPSGSDAYDFAYQDAMERIQSQHVESHKLAIDALSWITLAFRPLHKMELCHALAIELETSDLDDDNIPELEDILSVCCGLVVLDEKSDVVRLAHYTTQEYLERTGERWFPEARLRIANMCLTYICFNNFGAGPTKTGREYNLRCQKYPLFTYVAKNWGSHCRGTPAETGDYINPFFDDMMKMDAVNQSMMLSSPVGDDRTMRVVRENQAAHLAACCGLAKALVRLKDTSKLDFATKNTDGRTPLICAAMHAQKQCAEIIIAHNDSSINSKDFQGRTPLSYAAEFGDKEIVQLLMSFSQTDINSVDWRHRTPLSHAISTGHTEIVELLLSHPNIKADALNMSMETPIWDAVNRGRIDIVEILLARQDVNAGRLNQEGESILHGAIDGCGKNRQAIAELIIKHSPTMAHVADSYGVTPLARAVDQDDLGWLKILIAQTRVGFDLRDNSGRTPLSLAVESGTRESIAFILEQSRSQLNIRDHDGRSPLSWAAEEGRASVVKFLLGRRGIDLNSKDNEGITPVMYALQRGHLTISKLFFNKSKVALDSKDNHGRTLLHYAAQNNKADILRLLMSKVNIDVDTLDNDSRTPLSYALKDDTVSIEVVKILVSMSTKHIDLKDASGRTPLSYAAQYGSKEVVEFLMSHPGISIDQKDGFGRTPFSYAAENEYSTVVQFLIGRDDIDINSKDERGRTPLMCALKVGSQRAAMLILGHPDVDVVSTDDDGLTPLSYAVQTYSPSLLKLLISKDGVKIDSSDKQGRTPLSHAACYSGYAIQFLLKLPDVRVSSRDSAGRTPLSYAAEAAGHYNCKLLIGKAPTEVDARDHSGRTPLSYAAGSYSVEMVQLFLSLSNVEFDSVDDSGRSPLTYAIQTGEAEVCELLLKQDNIRKDRKDHSGRTMASFAAASNAFILRQLLALSPGIEVDLKDHYGRTALSYAAEEGSHLSVGLLIDFSVVDINSQDKEGRTPLSYAAKESHLCTELLLNRSDIDVNLPDNCGRTPLSYAADCGSIFCLNLLIRHPDVQLDKKDKEGKTPLAYAAAFGNLRHTELLMSQPKVDVNSKDQNGMSVLLEAVLGQHEDIVELLLSRADVAVNEPDNDGDDPLSLAMWKKDRGIISLILNRMDLDNDERRTLLASTVEHVDDEPADLAKHWEEFCNTGVT